MSKNIHLEHVEDLILNDGLAGAHMALSFLDNVTSSLAGSTNKSINVTTKWDGSPAIVVGTNPENGRFFVGTKSVFNKQSPKIVYTPDDAHRYYKDSPGLQRLLEIALKHLPKIEIPDGIVLQGDLMFTNNELKEEMIDGEKYTTFKPNTILYAIPFHSDLADKMRRAKLGVIFHTTYSGKTLKDMKATYKVSLKELRQSEDVWFDDATYQDQTQNVKLPQDHFKAVMRHLDTAQSVLSKLDPIKFEQLTAHRNLVAMIKMYVNHNIRGGKQFHANFMRNLHEFVEKQIEKQNLRDQTKEKKKVEYSQLLNRLEPTITNVVEFQEHVNEAKLILIKQLHKIEKIRTFIATGDGTYKVTKQEGFVAVDHLTNKAVKLVDRLDFSRNNFQFSKNKR